MLIRAIDHVNIRAPADDIAKLRRFYCDVVGLAEGWRPPFESRGHWLYVPGLGRRQLLLRDPLGIGVEITAAAPASP